MTYFSQDPQLMSYELRALFDFLGSCLPLLSRARRAAMQNLTGNLSVDILQDTTAMWDVSERTRGGYTKA